MEDLKAAGYVKIFHPYAVSNVFSKLFFTWTFPLFIKGFKNPLSEEDLYPPLQPHDSGYLGNKLGKAWDEELKRKRKNPSLWRALASAFGKQFIFLGLLYMCIEIFVRLAAPLLLAQFLQYFEPNSTMSKREAYYYAMAIVVFTFISVAFQHSYMLHNCQLGMKLKVAASTLIYRKALKLSSSALAETTVGQMINLISNDVARFDLAMLLHYLWLAPLEIIVTLILMYFYVGITGAIGIFLMLLFVPFQMWLGKKTSIYRLATAIKTDERIRLMNEIISGIQVIKMFTWEKPFAKLVEIGRREEMDEIKKISVIRAIMISFNIFLTNSAIYLCILVYVITGNILDAEYVYTLQSFYVILRVSVTMFLPQAVTYFAESNISVNRIKDFLLCEEVDFNFSDTFYNDTEISDKLKSAPDAISNLDEPVGIHMKKASFKWLKNSLENNLNDLDIDIGSNELAVLIGPVGCGKTTLLNGILGEVAPVTGRVKVNGKISYASQEPWLFAGTVRQNIIFGQKFDARKYHEVVRVCQLQRDFTLFPYGDNTMVGERGVSLSGGQRARINLARAVYKDADIYLLDDPLSAVDAHVGKQMFEECISKYLKEKCIVLITHQLQYLKNVKKLYLLGDRKIDHAGTYEEVQNSGKEFTKLLNDLKDIIDEEDDYDEVEAEIKDADGITYVRKRRVSAKELVPTNDEAPAIEKEGRGEGTVSWKIYKSYFKSGGHWCKILTLLIVFVLAQGLSSLIDYFLKVWIDMNQLKKLKSQLYGAPTLFEAPDRKNFTIKHLVTTENPIMRSRHTFSEDFWLSHMTDNVVLIAYTVLVILVMVLTIGRSLAFFRFCNKASIRLHNNMFYKVVHATMRFFNTNTSGRILNRFSKDMNQVDEVLPLTLLDTIQIALSIVAIIAVVTSVDPWMLVPTVVMLIIFYLIRVLCLSTSRDLKRLEGITRSPVYSHLTASLQGLTTIRAFGAQEILKREFDNYQNTYSSAYFMFVCANSTFGFWLDMHCVGFIALVTMSFLLFDTKRFSGSVGLAITQSLNLTGVFQWGMRQWSELENTMTCVERIKEYTDVSSEEDVDPKEPPRFWPKTGAINFDNLSLRYAADEPYVLKNLSFDIRDAEKIGIVGRTGAGKSSLIMALFRLAINEGKIIIDGVNINKLALTKLRSSIAIIPQEPVLFSGTLRKNLDPFDEYSDEVLWSGLEEVELKTAVSELPQGLETKISEGGANFSVGQKQLVCLARAIVTHNKILVLDEATANVDPQTDLLIQKAIRRKFLRCTVLTIAHRLHTIMDCDKIIVMDAGRVVEFDHPHELLQNRQSGVFYELVQQTGKAMAENLTTTADKKHRKSRKLKELLASEELYSKLPEHLVDV